MGEKPKQPKEEIVKNKEEMLEKSARPEFSHEEILKRLRQGDAAFVTDVINREREKGVSQEEIRNVREQAYEFFFKSGDFGSAMRMTIDLYGMDSEEWKRAASEMTRQTRKEYGLSESNELTPAEIKEIETDIEKLLERLDEYNYNSFSPKIQDEWYEVEQEATLGKDRELAKAKLERFINTLEKF